MDALSWLDSLPDPVRQALIGAAGDFSGGLAAQAVAALASMASGQVRRLFRPKQQQDALHLAMAEALAVTARACAGDDEVQMAHFLDMFGQWIGREDAAIELAKLIEPRPSATLDVDRLAMEFTAAGWDDEWLGEEVDFADVVATFARAFYDAAAKQPALASAIQIGLLRGVAERTAALVQESKRQSRLQERIAAAVEREHPLFLSQLEQRYLAGVYAEANDLPLADDNRPEDERTLDTRPRLQRIYVDLTTTTPTTAADRKRIEERLRHIGVASAEVKALARRYPYPLPGRTFYMHTMLMEERSGLGPRSAEELSEEWEWRELTNTMRYLQDHERREIAESLKVDPDDLAAAFANLAVLEAIHEHPQLVLLGDPGSGKSTLARRLAGLLAAAGCTELAGSLSADEAAGAASLEAGYGRWLLPVPIVLSQWAAHLDAAAGAGRAEDLIVECLRVIGQAGGAGDEQRNHFLARLAADPPTVLLLLDGLDEVTDPGRRRKLLAAVRDFAQFHGRAPLLITCRVRPYDALRRAGQALPLPEFTLDRLADAEVRRFVTRWHAEHSRTGLYPAEQADKARDRLLAALADPARDELHDMAGTPLLLTMMARVNYRHGLPDSRAQLYELYVSQLLYEWERRKLDAPDDPSQKTRLQALLERANVSPGSLNNALNKLAYEVHGQASRDTVDIPKAAVRAALEAIHPGEEAAKAAWAVELLSLIDDRTGLLIARELQAAYRFTHRTFQEYLAARFLATGRFLPKFRDKIDDVQWREAVLLALGFQALVQDPPAYDNALDVIAELLPDAPRSEADWRRVLLLGEAYARLLGPQRAGEADQQQRAQAVVEWAPRLLTAALQNRDLPPRTRLEAGLLLDDLELDPPGLDDFVAAPGWGFRMGRYPVTNTQFRRFWQAGGYDERRWWSNEGWSHQSLERWTQPRLWGDHDFDRPSQPVVGVSWYEAAAYCAWLTAQLRAAGAITAREEARLPSQAEWETAAHARERAYTWGDKFDAGLANTKASGLGRPTPVHTCAGAATPEGVWDMNGNVCEWTRDVDKNGFLWLKGGSWAWEAAGAASAARDWHDPRVRLGYFGFRVVVVPISR